MKAMHSIIAAAALAFVQPTPASAATTDPEVIIYRFTGVLSQAGAAGGSATVFHCTNFSGAMETLRFVTRDLDGTLVGNTTTTMKHLETVTASTHVTLSYFEGVILGTGDVTQGTTAIAATSINIVCAAMTIDISNPVPIGVALRGIRFSPVPGSQE
jgi:hypothetical protein